MTASGIAAIIRKGLRFPYLVSMLSETNPVIGPQKASQIGPAAAMVPAKAGSIPATDQSIYSMVCGTADSIGKFGMESKFHSNTS